MRPIAIFLVLLGVVPMVWAGDLDARQVRAKNLMLSPEAQQYAQASIWRLRLVSAQCVKRGFGQPESLRVLIDVNPSGDLENVRAESESPFSHCVVDRLNTITLASPPTTPFTMSIVYVPGSP
jgi:hypothetical protein